MRYSLTALFSFFILYSIAQAPADSMLVSKADVHASPDKKNKVPWNWIVPGVLVGLGVWGNFDNNIINRNEIKEERYEHLPTFHKNANDYAPYVPAAAVYFLNVIGQKAQA